MYVFFLSVSVLQRPFSFNTCVSPRYHGSDDRAHSARGHPNRRITKLTRNVNAPLYDGLDDRAHCAHGHPNRRVVSCFLTRASMGKINYYDKLKWQDSIKVIITQKLHQLRNWEFHNMLNGMSTIEMIENLKIENLIENRVIRRFGWPPTNCNQIIHLWRWFTHMTVGNSQIQDVCPSFT